MAALAHQPSRSTVPLRSLLWERAGPLSRARHERASKSGCSSPRVKPDRDCAQAGVSRKSVSPTSRSRAIPRTTWPMTPPPRC